MELKEYVDQYHGSVTKYAAKMNLSATTVWHYYAGTRRPSKKRVILMEAESGGRVTVKDLRKEAENEKER